VNNGSGWYSDGVTHQIYNEDTYRGNPSPNIWHDATTGYYAGSFTRTYPQGTQVAAKLFFASGQELAQTHDWTWWTWAHTGTSSISIYWDSSCEMPAYSTSTVGGCGPGLCSAIPAARLFGQ
jgi:hypothetical protein